MFETQSAPEPISIEIARQRLEIAMEAAFGGVMNHPENPMESQFVPMVEYPVDDDAKKSQLADLAVKELFKSAAEVEKMQTEEKKKRLTPYSDEFRALEKPGPHEIAYDYILGNRTSEVSASIATAVLSELGIAVDNKNWDFRRMKEDHFKRTEPTRVDWHEHSFLVEGQQKQIKKAKEYVYKKYNLRPATIDDTDRVKDVIKSRTLPLSKLEFSPSV